MIKPSFVQQLNGYPLHIAVIMDGNRRWALKEGKSDYEAYSTGAENLKVILEAAGNRGIRYFTAFCLSEENWNRPDNELALLMKLFRVYFEKYGKTLAKERVRFDAVGDRSRFPKDIAAALDELEKSTANNEGINFTVAFNYGGKGDIVQAARTLAEKVKSGDLKSEDIDEETFASHLLTKDLPEPDLLIRTSGEMRLSNFMLWQTAYSELYFSPKLWPDFSPEDLEEALRSFAGRERRYGARVKSPQASSMVGSAPTG